jgi:F-type H+-transporting ATPase subunit delta
MPVVKENPAAIPYAQATIELAGDEQQQAVGEELEQIRQVVRENPAFEQFLRDPSIAQSQRRELIQKVFGGRLSPLVMNLLGVMGSHGRLGLLTGVVDSYRRLLDQKLGRVNVDLTVASELDEPSLAEVQQRVSQALSRQAVIRQHVNDSIIGGLVLRVEDRLIDASVKSQLLAMRRKLVAAAPQ